MIRVQAPSRLHFGLFVFGQNRSATDDGLLAARQFGSVGMMLERPGVVLTARPANAWSAQGPSAERVLTVARRWAELMDTHRIKPQSLVVECCAPEHVGLGTGTQISLAVAKALSIAAGLEDLVSGELTRHLGRGRRSALGTHGFNRGGFLVDGGKRSSDGVAPLIVRREVPADWHFLLVLLPLEKGLHGEREAAAFRRLEERPESQALTDRLCRLVLLGMLPALEEKDLESFGEAVYEFNACVGDAFAPVQSGRYAHPAIGELIAFLRQEGVRGVGQSSWGPAVFAISGREETSALARLVRKRFGLNDTQIMITQACNGGAVVVNPGNKSDSRRSDSF
jgi:beta-RFAP synthase